MALFRRKTKGQSAGLWRDGGDDHDDGDDGDGSGGENNDD